MRFFGLLRGSQARLGEEEENGRGNEEDVQEERRRRVGRSCEKDCQYIEDEICQQCSRTVWCEEGESRLEGGPEKNRRLSRMTEVSHACVAGRSLKLTGATNDAALISKMLLPERLDTKASLRTL